jgi:Predicted Zn peptidase
MIVTREDINKKEIAKNIEKLRNDHKELLSNFPIDPMMLASKLGIKVYLVEFTDQSLSGGLRKNAEGTFEIYVNKNDGADRQRFTVAHELGHYILHTSGEAGFFEIVDLHRDGKVNVEEMEANEFAGSLLMPKDKVEELINQNWDLHDLAKYFGVSLSAIGYKISLLGL